MRLVIHYTVGDGYTYSCDITTPVVYESAEKFLVDLEEAVLARQAGVAKGNEIWYAFMQATREKIGYDVDAWKIECVKVREEKDRLEGNPLFCGFTDVFLDRFLEDGKFYAPEIYTVDEWFTINGAIE